jgi:hypothetical protein
LGGERSRQAQDGTQDRLADLVLRPMNQRDVVDGGRETRIDVEGLCEHATGLLVPPCGVEHLPKDRQRTG